MKRNFFAIGSTAVLLVVAGISQAHDSGNIEATEGSGYITTADGVLRGGTTTCVRRSGWAEDNQINECEGIEEEVAAAPEPEPEPVVEPAPEPQPAPQEPTITLATLGGEALFATNSHELNAAGQEALTNLVAQLGSFQEIEAIAVTGHTDSRGAESYNQALSERRAATVAAFLGGAFPSASMSSIGAGELSPIDTNDTAEGRQANRRVEIEVTAKSITDT